MMTKTILTTLRMVPIFEAVNLPMFAQQIDHATGEFKATEVNEKAGDAMLKELHKWAAALRTMRDGK
jgi:hypothetical protein